MKVPDQEAVRLLPFHSAHYNRNTLLRYSPNAAGSVPVDALDHKVVEELDDSGMAHGAAVILVLDLM